jgi:hypothetical protein
MIAQTKRPDLETLIQLCEHKSPYLTITKTPTHWNVAGKDQEHKPGGYESLEDCLLHFILGDTDGDSGQ